MYSLPFRGCFLSSPLVGSLAMSLQIPISMLFDVLLQRARHSPILYIGTVPIVMGLILVTLLTSSDDSDPLMRLLKSAYRKLCRCKKPGIVR